MIRAPVETILAALFIAAALFLFIFGPSGAMQVFHMTMPPAVVESAPLQVGLSVAALLAGGYFFVGVWAAYPGWRNALVTLSAVSTSLVVVLFTQMRVFGS